MSAMTLALFIMILYAGLVEGYLTGMRRNILDFELGEVQVYAHDYRKSPSLYERVESVPKIIEILEQEGFRVAPRLLGSGLAAAGSASAGVQLRGIDIARDARVSKIHEHVEKGGWLDAARPKGVVLGQRLAKTLAVNPGDELVVLGQAADGSMANELFTVEGVLGGVADGVDRAGVFVQEQTFRELYAIEAGVHQLIVRTPTGLQLKAARDRVEEITKDAAVQDQALDQNQDQGPGAEVLTWKQIVPSLASMLDSARASMMAMYLIIYLAIATVILNAMLMAVFERVREFGVLKAIGAAPRRIFVLVLGESMLQAVVAIVLGTLASLPALWYLVEYGIDLRAFGSVSVAGVAFNPIWRAEINANTFGPPIATLAVVVFIAVIYPAIRAALISPAQAMRSR